MHAATAPPPTQLVPLAAAAKQTGVSVWTLKRHCHDGRLPHARSSEGGKVLVAIEDVLALLRGFAVDARKAVAHGD